MSGQGVSVVRKLNADFCLTHPNRIFMIKEKVNFKANILDQELRAGGVAQILLLAVREDGS